MMGKRHVSQHVMNSESHGTQQCSGARNEVLREMREKQVSSVSEGGG